MVSSPPMELMTARMEAAAAQLGGIAGLAKQLTALGTPTEISPAYEGEAGGLKAFFIPCTFSLMPVDIVLVVQDGAVKFYKTDGTTASISLP